MNKKFIGTVITEIKNKGFEMVYDDRFDIYEVYTPNNVFLLVFKPREVVTFIPVNNEKDGELKFRGIDPIEVVQYFYNRCQNS